MAERYPFGCFGTETQRKLCNRYFEVIENNSDPFDWEPETVAYNDFMGNLLAEQEIGISTNDHMTHAVEKAHEKYERKRRWSLIKKGFSILKL